MNKIMQIITKFSYIGRISIAFVQIIGRKFIFFSKIIAGMFSPPFYFKAFVGNLLDMGVNSLPVIVMTAVFSGAVLALQAYSGFVAFDSEKTIAVIVVMSIVREMAPVVGGLMIAGRVGAAIASEVATMKSTEQLDALKTMSIDIYKYLFIPWVVAGVIAMPLLVIVADIIGIYGGYLVSVKKLGFSSSAYLINTLNALSIRDVNLGISKAIAFGFIITSTGCYCGYSCEVGARGVGKASTRALVYAAILILVVNYIITELFFIYDT